LPQILRILLSNALAAKDPKELVKQSPYSNSARRGKIDIGNPLTIVRFFVFTMEKNLLFYLRKFYQEEDGQAITEYGAMLAFIAMMIALVFTLSSGGLAHAVQTAFSGLGANINKMATAAS
jgi:Flp pilus assembly pilin Flp